MKITFWNIIKTIASGKEISNELREEIISNLKASIDKAYKEFEDVPQAVKDESLFNIAKRMGCESKNIEEATQFIRNYAKRAMAKYS